MRNSNKFFLVSCIITKEANELQWSHFDLTFPCSGDEMNYLQSNVFFSTFQSITWKSGDSTLLQLF